MLRALSKCLLGYMVYLVQYLFNCNNRGKNMALNHLLKNFPKEEIFKYK